MAGLKDTTEALARYRRHAAGLQARSDGMRSPPTLGRVTGFGADPGALDMRVHVPEGLPAGAPLVVALHGCTQTADDYASGAGWVELADRLGFLLLCPEQDGGNNAQRCFNWFEPGDTGRGLGEAASIRAMIEHAIVGHGLDRRRVFVTGLSAGGAMASVMLAAYPEVFAGGAIVAGLPFGAAGNVQEALAAMFQARPQPASSWGDRVRAASKYDGPWPRVSVWHGDADHTVQPVNLHESVKQWTDVHGLAPADSDAAVVGRDRRHAWADAHGRVLVESHLISGLGHGVPLETGGPDGVGVAGPFLLECGVSSSVEIARFWGLADAVPAVRGAAPSSMPELPPAPFRPARPAAGLPLQPGRSTVVGLDVEGVIHRALKAAGLIKAG